MKTKKVLILIVLFLLFFSLYCAYYLAMKKSDKKIAEIYQNGKLLYVIDLDDVKEPYTIEVVGDNGEINIIEVDKGKIRIKEANCPDKTCVHMGWISEGFLPVVCLPHHIVVEIKGGKNAEKLDDKAY